MKTSKHQWTGLSKELSSLMISLNKSSSLCSGNQIAWLCHCCDGSNLQSGTGRYGCSSCGHTIASVSSTASPIPSPPSFLIQQVDNVDALAVPPESKYLMSAANQAGIIPVTERGLTKELYVFSQFLSMAFQSRALHLEEI